MKLPRQWPRVAGLALGAGLLMATGCVRVTPSPGGHRGTPPAGMLTATKMTNAVPPSLPPAPPSPSPSGTPHGAASSPSTNSATAAETWARNMAVQIHLDQALCSPGGIDGRWGDKSRKALRAWQRMTGRRATGDLDAEALAALGSTNELWTSYVVTAADHAALTPYPTTWLGKSKQESLGYITIEEAVAERFHLYAATLRRLNPASPWPNPPAGTHLKVPARLSRKHLPALSRLEIRMGERTLRAYDAAGHLVAQFPCSIAADKAKRPVDRTLLVKVWAENPEYTFDPDLYADQPEAVALGKRLRIPPGPNNPVGLAWIGLDLPGYGIHGTPHPEDISHTESHGCFRLTNWDALRLVRAVHSDLPVRILP